MTPPASELGPTVFSVNHCSLSPAVWANAPAANERRIAQSLTSALEASSVPLISRYDGNLLHQLTDAVLAWGPAGILLLSILDSSGVPVAGVFDAFLILV